MGLKIPNERPIYLQHHHDNQPHKQNSRIYEVLFGTFEPVRHSERHRLKWNLCIQCVLWVPCGEFHTHNTSFPVGLFHIMAAWLTSHTHTHKYTHSSWSPTASFFFSRYAASCAGHYRIRIKTHKGDYSFTNANRNHFSCQGYWHCCPLNHLLNPSP